MGLLDDEVAARHLLLERSIDQRDVASLPAASTALARDGRVHGAPRTGGADYLAHMEFNSFASFAPEVRQNLYHNLGKDVDPAQTPRGKIP